MNSNRILRLIISVLIGVIAAGAIAYLQARAPSSENDQGYIGKPFGGDFAGLMDEDGRVLDRDAFAGKYQLVFFGFTHCPAICPTALQDIGLILKQLSPVQRQKLVPIFISVDPVRDTPDVMKNYLSVFTPGIVGLTGRQDALNRVIKDWKVYAAKVPLDGGDYTMDHSAFIYLRDPGGNLVGLYDHADKPDAVAAEIRAKIKG